MHFELKLSCQIPSYSDVVVVKYGPKISCFPPIERWVYASFAAIWDVTIWPKEYSRKDVMPVLFYEDSIILVTKPGKDRQKKRKPKTSLPQV